MEEAEMHHRLQAIEQKLDAVYISAEKTRKYFLTMLVGTVVAFVLPLIGLVVAIPAFMSAYSSLGSLGL